MKTEGIDSRRYPKLDVLVFAPHPDDAEIGMAGSILMMQSHGLKVGIVDLTDGEPTPHGNAQLRAAESAAANKVLGDPWRANLGLPNRSLQPTLEARGMVAGIIRQTRPNWLFAPYWVDAHPDHVAAVQLIEDARFWAKLTKTELPGEPHHPQRIYHYYCMHLKQHPQPAFVVDISEFWENKLAAVRCYHSQFIEGKTPPTTLDRLAVDAAWWGKSIGVQFGEPFHCREPIGIREFRGLV
jgi:bacillithiol biosynthesis deacetylase BshB1